MQAGCRFWLAVLLNNTRTQEGRAPEAHAHKVEQDSDHHVGVHQGIALRHKLQIKVHVARPPLPHHLQPPHSRSCANSSALSAKITNIFSMCTTLSRLLFTHTHQLQLACPIVTAPCDAPPTGQAHRNPPNFVTAMRGRLIESIAKKGVPRRSGAQWGHALRCVATARHRWQPQSGGSTGRSCPSPPHRTPVTKYNRCR